MFVMSVFVFVNIAIIQLLQVPNVWCFFPRLFPSVFLHLDSSHQDNTAHSNFNGQEIPHAIDRDAVDIASAESSFNPQFSSLDPHKSKCPSCICGTINRRMRIVGGVPTGQHEFPWMVSLSRKGKFYCGATVITKQHLLTAAHCVEGFTAREIKASLGEYNRALKNESSKTVVRIKQIIRHPEFQISNFKNDIAILKLDSPISFQTPHVQPACLPSSSKRNYTGMTAVVTGWGRTGESKPPSNEMRKVEVPIMSIDDCRKNSGYLPSRITENMMCAGYSTGQKDSCQGDSGGPLQISGSRAGTMEVVGIVSWGRGCARPSFPGVYTRIESYMPWVDSNIEEECSCKG